MAIIEEESEAASVDRCPTVKGYLGWIWCTGVRLQVEIKPTETAIAGLEGKLWLSPVSKHNSRLFPLNLREPHAKIESLDASKQPLITVEGVQL